MSSDALPEDPAQQWDVLLCIIAFEERKKDNRPTGATETLNYIFHHEGIQKIFTEWLLQMKRFYDKQWAEDTSRKSDELSALWRERGNVKFKLQLYDEAYSLYNKSVLYAKKDSPLYSIAMANRSAVSLRLKRYEDCLLDVQRALRHEYPPELQHKLILRRAECYYQMGLGEPCVDAMNEALKYNNRVQLRGISKIDFDNTFHAMENKLDLLNLEPVPQSVERLPKLFQGENPKFRSASNAVELVRNDEVGRHVLVKKPVKRGDVLFSEEPFASVKLPTNQLPHPYYCDHCCSGDQAVIGCCKCSRAIYCDDGCYAINKKMYHRWECAGLRYNIFQNIGIAHLAFRVLLKYAYLSFPPLPEDVKEPTTADALLEAYANVDSVGVYGTEYSAFYSMFQLATNLDIPANVDFMQYAVTSTMLTIYLEQHTKFFKYFAKKVRYPLPFHELKLLCAGLIFRTLGQLVTNANTVMELNAGPVREIPNCFLANCIRNPWRKVGSAVYPSASMMNHSCEPNITSLFYKNHLYVKAITELPVGEEVLNCYGPHYARHNTEVRRQRLLNQYGFECKCRACVDSTRNNFVSMFSAYVCTSCKGPVMWEGARMSCHQCTTEFPQQKAQNAAETAEAMQAIAMQAKTKEEKCRLMLRAYKLMQQVLYRHHNVLRKAIDDLAMLYNAIEEYSKSYDLVKQNIQSFEYQYGSFSVEVTNELRKLSNLMLGRIMRFLNNPEADAAQPIPIKEWIVETLYITKKANQLMELNFGTWQPMYKVVKDNEEVLESMVAEPCDEEDIGCFNMLLQNLNFT